MVANRLDPATVLLPNTSRSVKIAMPLSKFAYLIKPLSQRHQLLSRLCPVSMLNTPVHQLQSIFWADYSCVSMIQYIGVNHGCPDAGVSQQYLNCAYIIASLWWTGGLTWPKASVAVPLRMPKSISTCWLAQSGGEYCFSYCLLDHTFV